MRPSTLAAAAALTLTFGFAGSAFAQEDGGWFEPDPSDPRPPTEVVEDSDGPEEDAEPVEEVVVKKRRKRRVLVVDGDSRSPEWTRGRRGRQKRVIPAREGEEPPPGYRLGYRSRRNVWIPGVTLLAGGYVASALTSLVGLTAESSNCYYDFYGAGGCETHDWGWGFLPLAGPWFITADSSFDGGWRVAYGIMGVAQDLGLILTIAGAASKRPVWIHSPNRAEAAPALMPQVSVGPASASMSMAF